MAAFSGSPATPAVSTHTAAAARGRAGATFAVAVDGNMTAVDPAVDPVAT